MDWLMLHSKGILQGSLSTADNTTQIIWIKFLCLANETRDRDGYLRYKEGKPYPLELIAMRCNVSMEELKVAIDDFMDDVRDNIPRIEYAEDGSIKLNNWGDYQTAHRSAVKELPPRVRSALEKEAMTRKAVNQYPEVARDTLNQDFGDSIIDKQGEIIRDGRTQ